MSDFLTISTGTANALMRALGWALVLFLGQGAVAWFFTAVILRAARGRPSELRYVIACAGLAIMALCPVVTLTRVLWADRTPPAPVTGSEAPTEAGENPDTPSLPDRSIPPSSGAGDAANARIPDSLPPKDADASAEQSSGNGRRWGTILEAWLPSLVGLWSLGAGFFACRLIWGLAEVRSLTRTGLSPLPPGLGGTIGRLVDRAGLRARVSWSMSSRVEVPSVLGWLRPTVLIPAASLAQLKDRQVEALLAHEIAHILRQDYLANLAQLAVETLLFYHPAVWWVSKRIRIERESCCDEVAVRLCDGDRLLVARALMELEVRRAGVAPRMAADGGSLGDRIRRLVSSRPASPCPAAAGWVALGLILTTVAIASVTWWAGSGLALARSGESRTPGVIQGRILDEAGRPIPGARVRLYVRYGLWERRHPMLEEASSGPDGRFRLRTRPSPVPLDVSRGNPPYVLLADHASKAVGWKTLPREATEFDGEITLTEPNERTIRVIDAAGRPVASARVVAAGLGESTSASPYLREPLEGLRPDDGPLTALTDAEGRAVLRQLPKTQIQFAASKPGFAENYAFRDGQDVIGLGPAANLSGTLRDPDGRPLAGIKMVLFPDFLWDFEYAVTDSDGKYHFDGLKPRGYDMQAWRANQTGTGTYKLWLKDERFAIPTATVTFEPNEAKSLDIQAEPTGVIRVTLTEQGTGKPVPDARIWGSDAETRSSGRFNAYTDKEGRAIFYSVPARINLSVVGPPAGVYIRGNMSQHPGSVTNLVFRGGEQEVALTMPPIAGPLIQVAGLCKDLEGKPVEGAKVYAATPDFVSNSTMNHVPNVGSDRRGTFLLDGIPSGQSIQLYAESSNLKFAGTAVVRAPDRFEPGYVVSLAMSPTITVDLTLEDRDGKPVANRTIRMMPQVDKHEFPEVARTFELDARGKGVIEGVVPGLSYHLQEQMDPQPGAGKIRAVERLRGYDEVWILAPTPKERVQLILARKSRVAAESERQRRAGVSLLTH